MSLPRNQILKAIGEARSAAPARNFTQSFDLTVNLRELDMNRPDERVNARIQLPRGVGARKVLVFASGDLALRARRAGADSVVEPTELSQLASDKKEAKKRFKDYDVFVAEAPMMPTVGRVAGPILGPRGKMPIPVPPQAPIDEIIERERRVVVLRSRDKPFVNCIIGKEDMADEDIAMNIETVVVNLTNNLKRGYGNIRNIYLKLTMGNSVKVY